MCLAGAARGRGRGKAAAFRNNVTCLAPLAILMFFSFLCCSGVAVNGCSDYSSSSSSGHSDIRPRVTVQRVQRGLVGGSLPRPDYSTRPRVHRPQAGPPERRGGGRHGLRRWGHCWGRQLGLVRRFGVPARPVCGRGCVATPGVAARRPYHRQQMQREAQPGGRPSEPKQQQQLQQQPEPKQQKAQSGTGTSHHHYHLVCSNFDHFSLFRD